MAILHDLEIFAEGNLLTLLVDSVLDGELARLCDPDSLLRLVAGTLRNVLDSGDDVHALEDLAEYDVAAIEPRGRDLSGL